MSAPQWKPGDVAMVLCSDGKERRAFHHIYMGRWTWAFGDNTFRDSDTSEARPLVVIDAEDREQIERWRDEYDRLLIVMYRDPDPRDVTPEQRTTAAQAALRSLVTPPKPEEPQGLGAVVEASAYDTDDDTFVRAAVPAPGRPWANSVGVWHDWAELDAVRVLSEGWRA